MIKNESEDSLMGRHPKDELSKRSKSLRLRLTPAEHAWIKTIAETKEINMREALWQPFQKMMQRMDPEIIAELSVKVKEEIKKTAKK